MEHESFEDEATAALMNEHFVPVKVDREERPDVDSVYMDAVVSLTGHGGWPMTVFLTPAGEPFFGGTYYPPEPRHGLPSFPSAAAGDRRRVARTPLRHRARRRRDHGAAAPHGRAITRAADVVPADGRRARASAAVRSRVGRVRHRAEVPAGLGARVPAPPRRARARDEDARRDGRRRHVRPRRRRLPPVLRRPRVARAALREDALRQRAARSRVSARLARDGQRRATARSPTETLDYMLRELRLRRRRIRLRRRTPTRTASKGSRTRGRRRTTSRTSCCTRSSTDASSSAARSIPRLRARLFEERERRPEAAA